MISCVLADDVTQPSASTMIAIDPSQKGTSQYSLSPNLRALTSRITTATSLDPNYAATPSETWWYGLAPASRMGIMIGGSLLGALILSASLYAVIK